MDKRKAINTKETKVESIGINIRWDNGDYSENFIQRHCNVNKLIKENPVLQRIVEGELA
jgi:hypothetical protein